MQVLRNRRLYRPNLWSHIRLMMRVVPLPALSDNYMYLIIDDKTKKAAVVDPVDVLKINTAVKSEGVNLSMALVTHHHFDHAGGTNELQKSYNNQLPIYGYDDRIQSLSNKVVDGDEFMRNSVCEETIKYSRNCFPYSSHTFDDILLFSIGSLKVRCMHTPCHTSGHICYYVADGNDDRAVFTGDTLFIGGCGRFFEGTAEQMHEALCVKLASLPDDTKVYCGHEYTTTNLLFARSVEEHNKHVEEKLTWSRQKVDANEYTVPSTIGDEKLYNPFMRVSSSDELKKATGQTDPIKIMSVLREMKNKF